MVLATLKIASALLEQVCVPSLFPLSWVTENFHGKCQILRLIFLTRVRKKFLKLFKTAGVCSSLINRLWLFADFLFFFKRTCTLICVCRWQKVNDSMIIPLRFANSQPVKTAAPLFLMSENCIYIYIFFCWFTIRHQTIVNLKEVQPCDGSTHPPSHLAVYWLSEEAGQLTVPEVVGACPCCASTAR